MPSLDRPGVSTGLTLGQRKTRHDKRQMYDKGQAFETKHSEGNRSETAPGVELARFLRCLPYENKPAEHRNRTDHVEGMSSAVNLPEDKPHRGEERENQRRQSLHVPPPRFHQHREHTLMPVFGAESPRSGTA